LRSGSIETDPGLARACLRCLPPLRRRVGSVPGRGDARRRLLGLPL